MVMRTSRGNGICRKMILIAVAVVLCVTVGAVIFFRMKSASEDKKKEETQREQQEKVNEKEKTDLEADIPYNGEGLKEANEKEEAVESISWTDSEEDIEEKTEEGTKIEGTSEKDTLKEDVLDDGKEWGENIS